MLIDEKLNKIKDYLVSLRYLDGKPVIDVEFKEDWVVPKSEYVKIHKYGEYKNTYMFQANKEGLTMDDLTDFVTHVINMNIEREQKMILLQGKIVELQKFILDHNLDDLKRMQFIIPQELGEPRSWDDYTNTSSFENLPDKTEADVVDKTTQVDKNGNDNHEEEVKKLETENTDDESDG